MRKRDQVRRARRSRRRRSPGPWGGVRLVLPRTQDADGRELGPVIVGDGACVYLRQVVGEELAALLDGLATG